MERHPSYSSWFSNEPNDHPHGGGEGRAPIGRPSPMSPWGKPTLGKKTRRGKNHQTNLSFVDVRKIITTYLGVRLNCCTHTIRGAQMARSIKKDLSSMII